MSFNIPKIIVVKNAAGKIVTADGFETQYFPSIATFMGWDYLKADLSLLEKADLARTLASLQTTGARNKFFYRHTYSGTKKGMYQLVTKSVGELYERSFPNLKDISRPGAWFTPCYNGVYKITGLRILVVSDDDPRYQTGDGQGCMTKAGFEYLSDAILGQSDMVLRNHPFQFRMYIPHMKSTKRKPIGILAKGMLNTSSAGIPHPSLGERGDIHIILPISCLKGRWKTGMQVEGTYDVVLGVMGYAKAGKIQLGYMFRNFVSDEVNAAMREEWPAIAKAAHEAAQNPKTFVKSLPNEPLRNEDGSVNVMGFMRGAAMVADDTNNIALLEHRAFQKKLSELFANRNIRYCLSNGVEGIKLKLLADASIPDGVVYGNSVDIIAGRACVIRYPITLYSGVAVTAFHRDWVPEGCLFANKRTLAILAADQDGDEVGLVPTSYARWVAVWWESINKRAIKTEKFRSKAKMVATNALEMGLATRYCDTGRTANVLTQMRAACHKDGNKFFSALKLWCAANDVLPEGIGPFEFMELQVQAAVDSTKTGSMPDAPKIEMIAGFIKEWLLREDWAFAQIGNGSVKVWRDDDEGNYKIPSMIVTKATPMGKALCELGDKLPQLKFSGWNNEYFSDYLPYCTSDEVRNFVNAQWGILQDTMRSIKSEAVEDSEEIGDVFRNWEMYWNTIRQTQAPEVVEQIALRFWELISDGGGSNDVRTSRWCAWTALPEVIFDLLRKHADRVKPVKKEVRGQIVFTGFKDIIGDKDEITIECTIIRGKSVKNMTRECFQPTGSKQFFMVSAETPAINRKGKVNVTFHRTAKSAVYNFVINGETKAGKQAKAQLDRALAK